MQGWTLVTGGAGVMGVRLVDALRKKGEQVRILALPGDPKAESLRKDGLDVRFGDISNAGTLDGLTDGISTVFHLAAVILSPGRPGVFRKVNTLGTKNLVESCEASGVKHFIYVSSASVTYPVSNAYARSKMTAEDIIRRSRVPYYTIVRPTLAYEEDGAEEFVKFTEYLKRFSVVPFIGKGRARKAPVHVEDIISGLLAIPGNPRSYGNTYNLSGPEVLTIHEMAERILKHMGRRKRIVSFPVFLCRMAAAAAVCSARLTGWKTLLTWQTITGMTQNADLDNAGAVSDLGFNPRPFSEGLRNLEKLRNCLAERASIS